MKRINTQQKIAEARRSQSYRNILVREAVCYLTALACLRAVGITSDRGELPSLVSIVQSNKNDSIESCLQKWMMTTGEMRNHEAVRCHIDANSSHKFEVYSLFHRAGVQIKDGYLYLPIDNIVIQIICDKHLMICNLNSTPHVADESRSTHNFSKVHGPNP